MTAETRQVPGSFPPERQREDAFDSHVSAGVLEEKVQNEVDESEAASAGGQTQKCEV